LSVSEETNEDEDAAVEDDKGEEAEEVEEVEEDDTFGNNTTGSTLLKPPCSRFAAPDSVLNSVA
tara:strand:- start:57 stop:248 length:192 start_codon:yes stop_codon:yes gene_type:complete